MMKYAEDITFRDEEEEGAYYQQGVNKPRVGEKGQHSGQYYDFWPQPWYSYSYPGYPLSQHIIVYSGHPTPNLPPSSIYHQ